MRTINANRLDEMAEAIRDRLDDGVDEGAHQFGLECIEALRDGAAAIRIAQAGTNKARMTFTKERGVS